MLEDPGGIEMEVAEAVTPVRYRLLPLPDSWSVVVPFVIV
jgi:hypothetical protein